MVIQYPVKNETPVRSWAVTDKAAVASQFITNNGFDAEQAMKKQHDMEPLKKAEDIQKVINYLLENKRYRDNLLFVAGINFGFRVSDLVDLQVGHLIDENGNYREKICKLEKKTDQKLQADGTYKAGKVRTVYVNDAVKEAADLYLQECVCKNGSIDLSDWLFPSECRRVKNKKAHITEDAVYHLLQKLINDECGINIRAGTHTLRKTFAYHIIMGANDRARAVEFLQKIFNHSSSAVTLHYAGITDDEIMEAYKGLNLGLNVGMAHSAGLFAQRRANVG